MGTKYSDAGLSSASPVAGSEKWGVTKSGVSKYISPDLIWTYFQTLTSNLAAVARVGVRKNSAGSTYNRRRLNLIEGSGVTLTVVDDSGNEEVDITIAASGGGSSTGLVARAHLSARITCTTNATVVFNADTVDYDPGSAVTTGASWHYTVPTVTGTVWYDVRLANAQLYSDGNAWQNDKIADSEVWVNGSAVGIIRSERCNANDGTTKYLDLSGSLAVPCVTGDTIQVKVWNPTGAQRKIETDSAIEIYRVT